MQKVQLSPELLARLGGANFTAELCDEAGATKAVVLPVELYREILSARNDDGFRIVDLARARAETGGYTTAEAIAYLKKLIADRSGS